MLELKHMVNMTFWCRIIKKLSSKPIFLNKADNWDIKIAHTHIETSIDRE